MASGESAFLGVEDTKTLSSLSSLTGLGQMITMVCKG
jgi:hypothetical protein